MANRVASTFPTARNGLAFGVIALIASCSELSCSRDNNGPNGPETTPVTSQSETANNSEPQWVVRREGGPAKVAIVFVHGLFGDTIGTWTHKSGTRFFDLVASDPAIYGNVDILAFGYPSHMFKSGSFDILAAGKALHARLEHHGILNYQKVVFVGHSMGGLVIMRELLMNRAVLPTVPVIVLISTPQEGAEVANVADYIARNAALSQLTPANRNDLLQMLNDDWKAWPDRPKVRCAYENTKTGGVVLVVNWSSSTRFCDATVEVSADHIAIAKPENKESLSVITVTNALKEYVFNPALEPKLETPDFSTEGDDLIYRLPAFNVRTVARVENNGGSDLTFSLVEASHPDALLLWPHRPEVLAARQASNIFLVLLQGASGGDFRFRLKTDYGLDRMVIVRAPNSQALNEQRLAMLQGLGGELAATLDNSAITDGWKATPAEDGSIPDAVASIAKDHVATNYPELPIELQWVIAADLLNGLNWPGLAQRALRTAVGLDPTIAEMSSIRHLSAVASAHSGEPSVVIDAPGWGIQPDLPMPRNQFAINPGVVDANRLSAKLKEIPALEFYGLSLEGDAKRAAGDVRGAQIAFQNAAAIRPAPSVTRRLESVGGWRELEPVPERPDPIRPDAAVVPGITEPQARIPDHVLMDDAIVIRRPSTERTDEAAVRARPIDPHAIVVQPPPDQP